MNDLALFVKRKSNLHIYNKVISLTTVKANEVIRIYVVWRAESGDKFSPVPRTHRLNLDRTARTQASIIF